MPNKLIDQTSPYLLQHANNPVNWYPWGKEAFERAREEDKPVFLSIGYSTCHWCHVMAHESFEDEEVAGILNQYFISIKVDKEERPDIDNIYMAACQAFTGSGGWPMSIFMTHDQKPFFAATYFPKTGRFGSIGFMELLTAIQEKWKSDRQLLLDQADVLVSHLTPDTVKSSRDSQAGNDGSINSFSPQKGETLIKKAFLLYQRMFDREHGGFGQAPKFPTPHNLLFLMEYAERFKNKEAGNMAEKTLIQMYRGGMFDHIGGGFSRYSTDERFLVPHFEKMLYDNVLLIMAYCKAYGLTRKAMYRQIAVRSADYILREMTSPEGVFYSAQDADSEGIEGKYYVFTPDEIIHVLGKEKGEAFNQIYDITDGGNFEGKSIPNLLKYERFEEHLALLDQESANPDRDMINSVLTLYEYRKNRYFLHMDDKILTSWNSLMIAALCQLYRITGTDKYLEAAKRAEKFILEQLCKDHTLWISYRNGKRGEKGLLDDYAYQIFALLALYETTFDGDYLDQAQAFIKKMIHEYWDDSEGGFFLSGKANEPLILRPKETYDGAVFSANSALIYSMLRLAWITGEKSLEERIHKQLSFMTAAAWEYPAGYAMFLTALLDHLNPPVQITAIRGEKEDDIEDLSCKLPLNAYIRVLDFPTDEYTLKNNETTFYICKNHTCQPPVSRKGLEFDFRGQ